MFEIVRAVWCSSEHPVWKIEFILCFLFDVVNHVKFVFVFLIVVRLTESRLCWVCYEDVLMMLFANILKTWSRIRGTSIYLPHTLSNQDLNSVDPVPLPSFSFFFFFVVFTVSNMSMYMHGMIQGMLNFI